MNAPRDWTDSDIATLRTLWDEGLSTAEIGRRMGLSKNAVVGKAHRLNLPARPSPIRREYAAGARRRPNRTYAERQAITAARKPRMATGPGVPAPPPRKPAVTLVPRYGRQEPCCWVVGEPAGRRTIHCDAPSLAGRPYCEAHAALAYLHTRNRGEAAYPDILRRTAA